MGIFFNRKSSEEQFRSNPAVQHMINSIERYGTYTGSDSSKATAQRAFDMQANYGGCLNPRTKTIYWKTLEESNLLIPLAVAYAFAIGEYLENPMYDPARSGGNTSNAKMSAQAIGMTFPNYKNYVERNHYGNEVRYILALSANIINIYL